MTDEVFKFWNNAQTIYDSLVNKTMNNQMLCEQEALTFMELGQMLENYYKLQRLIVSKDIDKWEPKDDSDGFANAST